MARTSRRSKKQSVSVKKRFSKRFKKYDLFQSWLGLLLGAIVVIVLGFLVASFLTRNSGQIGTGEKTSMQDTQMVSAKTMYKVKESDSLSLIAKETYGNSDMWQVLALKNNITNPDLIYADTNLELPSKADAEASFKDLTVTSFDVHSGDTLFGIAQRVYGDGSRWTEIARANNVGYLENGNPLIFSGNTLIIPR